MCETTANARENKKTICQGTCSKEKQQQCAALRAMVDGITGNGKTVTLGNDKNPSPQQ